MEYFFIFFILLGTANIRPHQCALFMCVQSVLLTWESKIWQLVHSLVKRFQHCISFNDWHAFGAAVCELSHFTHGFSIALRSHKAGLLVVHDYARTHTRIPPANQNTCAHLIHSQPKAAFTLKAARHVGTCRYSTTSSTRPYFPNTFPRFTNLCLASPPYWFGSIFSWLGSCS